MIANLIGGFVAIMIGVALIGPISTEVRNVTAAGSDLQLVCNWGASIIQLVPGFFSLGILGLGVAVTYSSLRQAGIV